MNKIGNVDQDKLDIIKDRLSKRKGDELINDALGIIGDLENMIATIVSNYQSYIVWSNDQYSKLQRQNTEMGWQINPDTSGGAFTQEEIDRSRNGGW